MYGLTYSGRAMLLTRSNYENAYIDETDDDKQTSCTYLLSISLQRMVSVS